MLIPLSDLYDSKIVIPKVNIPNTKIAILLNPVKKDKIKNITVSNIEQVLLKR